MYKKRGFNGIERLMDNAFDNSQYLLKLLKNRPGFQLVMDKFEYTCISFWYIPKYMRQREPKDDKWWLCIHKLTGMIKESMVLNGNLMVAYQPLASKMWSNFFRVGVTCHPVSDRKSMEFVIDEIERIGESYEYFDKF